jgi:serine/threonine protein kinase
VELGGAVEVLGQLGAGTFGRVFLCRVKGIDGQVAVKLRESGAQPEGCLEGQLDHAELAHPRLVRLIQVFHCSVDALVFELCAGGSLQDLVHRRRGTFTCSSVSQRLRVVSQVVSAASYLHSMQIVHRDIKPSNVFLMHPVADAAVVQLPPVKLGDLGLARLVRSWRDPREMERCVGTTRYMAPEVMTEIDYGRPADIFSCAIMMHELVSGQTPYSSPKKPTESKLMLDVLGGERPSLELVSAPGTTLQLRNLVAACWQPDPALRPDADALLAEVQDLLYRISVDEDSID